MLEVRQLIPLRTVSRQRHPLELEEKKASACVQAGGVFVDGEFEQYLTRILNRIDIDEEERGDYIRQRNKVESFFEKCVTQTIESVRQQMSELDCKHILVVGGFGESLYLRKELTDAFGNSGCTVNIANDSTAKAVADGAVIWCGKLSVVSRATRMPFGVEINDPYNAREPNHAGRPVHRHDAGYDYVTGKWSQIVGRGVVMNADGAMRESYWRSYKTPTPAWPTSRSPCLPTLLMERRTPGCAILKICEVEADLSGMRQALKRKTGRDGEYYYLDFTMALQFGGTEIQAFVEWEQDGETRTGPASILPSALTSAQL
ncbi:ATP binding [Rhizoctonia solani]|uniref:ATP binding n=1 Tax=Rhizoctonia solani TaxID=456999 RepID=A0A8H7ICQ0_9AGAM|nr:ATP binding [Rhizoctonia solani]